MRRDDGTPAQVGDTIRNDHGMIHFDPPRVDPSDMVDSFTYAIEGLRRNLAEHVPNRLYGATITPEGDAI
jgi:hypothetical protein